jgi:hypothetical protein
VGVSWQAIGIFAIFHLNCTLSLPTPSKIIIN